MDGFGDLVWDTIPARIRRFAPTLARIFGDGAYLRAWPRVAAITPLAALAVGALLGVLYGLLSDGAVYTASILTVAVLATLGAFGAGIGCAAWAGFVAADLLVTDRTPLPGFDPVLGHGFFLRLTHGYVPLLMAYALLFGLVVLAPLIGRSFAGRAEAAVGRRRSDLATVCGAAVYILVMQGAAYAWSQAVAVLVRPLWSFSGSAPEADAVQPVQSHPVLLTALVGGAALGRAVVTALAGVVPAAEPPARRPMFWRIASEPLQAAVITLLLAGLVVKVLAGLVFFLLILGLLAIRTVVVPMIPGYAQGITRVPLLIRLAVCIALSYVMGAHTIGPAMGPAATSTTALTISVLLSLLVSMFLLPGEWVWTRSGLRPSLPAQNREPDDSESGILYRATGFLMLAAWPAYAENCPGLTGCTLGAGIGTVTASIVAVLLMIVTLPEILAAGADTAGADTSTADSPQRTRRAGRHAG